MTAGVILAGGAFAILVAGWIGYPLALRLLGGGRTRPAATSRAPSEAVAVVIATREAPDVVRDRVTDLLRTDWPEDRLSIVIGVDTTGSHPLDGYNGLFPLDPRIRVVSGDLPGGKAATLNAAVRAVDADVVVFADSAQTFEAAAIPALVEALRAEDVGGVTGQITTDVERGVFGVFWRYELLLRRLESRLGVVVAVTGAIHAMRREAWQPLPTGLICDDLLIPLRLGRRGLRVVVAEGALARDPRRFPREVQLSRKVRTLTGMLQVCAWEPWVLLPWAHRMWGAFLCHKLIRVATPALAGCVAIGVLLILPSAWSLLLVGLVGVGIVSTIVLAQLREQSLATELVWTMRLLAAPLVALGHLVRGDWNVWTPHAVDDRTHTSG